jgi:hypothetical protein
LLIRGRRSTVTCSRSRTSSPLLLGDDARHAGAVPAKPMPAAAPASGEITVASLAAALNEALGDAPAVYPRAAQLGGEVGICHPPTSSVTTAAPSLGPRMAVGAAPALRGSGRNRSG